jgi:glycosyltransferase involved in cell wall biosynthesis
MKIEPGNPHGFFILAAYSPRMPSSLVPPIPEISVVLPAFNEEAALPIALAAAAAALTELAVRWEIVVVDDGSTDNTPRILTEAETRDPRIRTLRQPFNRGYSAALIRGFLDCRYEAVFYTDADGQFDLRELASAYPLLAGADMVAGWRQGRCDPWTRRLASRIYNLLQSTVLGVRARDVDCAFKLFRRSFFERVILSSEGFLIDSELYARAARRGLRVAQLPVTHHPRIAGRSTVRLATVWRSLVQLARLARTLRAEARTAALPETPGAGARMPGR